MTDLNLREQILNERYLRKNLDGFVIETSDQMFERVGLVIAEVEAKYCSKTKEEIEKLAKKFTNLMKLGKFLPNSPTLMNAGSKNGMLSACFVLPIFDSIESIFDCVKNAALVQKAGGGTGFSFDNLRPTGDLVASSGGKTSGPIGFMRVISEGTKAIQRGAFRRGANMGMMGIGHPDVLAFIHAKDKQGAFENFNLSIKITNEFMDKLFNNPKSPHVVRNPRTSKEYLIPININTDDYSLQDLTPMTRSRMVWGELYSIEDIWNLIIKQAHSNGEPGVCFIDRINEDNPTPLIGQIESTNPCGEQPLLAYEACNLGSINLIKFIDSNKKDLNWITLANVVRLAVRFLDNTIDANSYPTNEIHLKTMGNRKIGLGIMGFADVLSLLGIKYNSQKGISFGFSVSKFIQAHAHNASHILAREKGSFPNWKNSIWDTKYKHPMRNASVTTIAPTGTISIIANCSSGIEPVFDSVVKRRILDKEFVETKNNVLTAHEIEPEWHVRMQGAFQKNVDNGVSKTVNLPFSATIEDVDKIFRLAYKLGCKGTTVYRDGSRKDQVLSKMDKRNCLVCEPSFGRNLR